MSTTTEKAAPILESEVVSTIGVAEMTDCTSRHIQNLDQRGMLPNSIRLGRLKKWSKKTILLWIDSGCLSREKFEQWLEEQKS